MTTLTQRRLAYNRLLIIREVYGRPGWLAALKRARRATLEANSRHPARSKKERVTNERQTTY